jgi:hypothetical protein
VIYTTRSRRRNEREREREKERERDEREREREREKKRRERRERQERKRKRKREKYHNRSIDTFLPLGHETPDAVEPPARVPLRVAPVPLGRVPRPARHRPRATPGEHEHARRRVVPLLRHACFL